MAVIWIWIFTALCETLYIRFQCDIERKSIQIQPSRHHHSHLWGQSHPTGSTRYLGPRSIADYRLFMVAKSVRSNFLWRVTSSSKLLIKRNSCIDLLGLTIMKYFKTCFSKFRRITCVKNSMNYVKNSMNYGTYVLYVCEHNFIVIS